MFNSWRDEGFQKNEDNISFNRFKLARIRFRYLVKNSKNQSTIEHYISIDKLKQTNPKSFWKQLKLHKNPTTKLYAINGKSNNQDITPELADHFNMLLNTPRTPNTVNENTNQQLQDILHTLETYKHDNFYVTENDVTTALKHLKTEKARDPFQLKAEHFIYAQSEQFTAYLTELINNIFTSAVLPPSLIPSLVKSHK